MRTACITLRIAVGTRTSTRCAVRVWARYTPAWSTQRSTPCAWRDGFPSRCPCPCEPRPAPSAQPRPSPAFAAKSPDFAIILPSDISPLLGEAKPIYNETYVLYDHVRSLAGCLQILSSYPASVMNCPQMSESRKIPVSAGHLPATWQEQQQSPFSSRNEMQCNSEVQCNRKGVSYLNFPAWCWPVPVSDSAQFFPPTASSCYLTARTVMSRLSMP